MVVSPRKVKPSQKLDWYALNGANSVAAILREGRRGIYVLEFENGERYVGRAEDAVRRFAQHRHGGDHHQPWADISAFGFMAVPEGNLATYERAMLLQQKAGGFVFRNKTWNFDHTQPSALDRIVPVEVQEHWSTGLFLPPNREALEEAVNRVENAAPRLLRARRGKEMLPGGLATYEAVIDSLARLIVVAIPQPVETEGWFWSLSDYPSTAGGRFATLNVGNLELLFFPRRELKFRSAYFGSKTNGIFGRVNAEPGTFGRNRMLGTRPRARFMDDRMDNQNGAKAFIERRYYSIPVDTMSFPLGSSAITSLTSQEIIGIRRLAVRSMRNASAKLNARSHSSELTRLVYQRMLELIPSS